MVPTRRLLVLRLTRKYRRQCSNPPCRILPRHGCVLCLVEKPSGRHRELPVLMTPPRWTSIPCRRRLLRCMLSCSKPLVVKSKHLLDVLGNKQHELGDDLCARRRSLLAALAKHLPLAAVVEFFLRTSALLLQAQIETKAVGCEMGGHLLAYRSRQLAHECPFPRQLAFV
eukprot:5451606-Pleurochrysis_carterae.AAC.1